MRGLGTDEIKYIRKGQPFNFLTIAALLNNDFICDQTLKSMKFGIIQHSSFLRNIQI